jgi:hypothetical protein
VDAGEAAQDIVGAVVVRLQHACQTDQGTQTGADVVGLQTVGQVEGEMPFVTAGAVVIGTFVFDVAVGGPPRLGAVVDETGVGLAEWTDNAGTYVALFLPV